MVPIMFLVLVFFGGFAVAGSIMWLLAQKSLGGRDWEKRFSRLEAEVKRLAGGQMPQDLEDEVRHLDEKVEFLENLLAQRPGLGCFRRATGMRPAQTNGVLSGRTI